MCQFRPKVYSVCQPSAITQAQSGSSPHHACPTPHLRTYNTGEVHGVGQVTWPTGRLRGTCESRNHILNRLTQIHLLTWRSLLQEVRDRGQGQQPQHHAGGGQPCEGDDGVRNTWRLPQQPLLLSHRDKHGLDLMGFFSLAWQGVHSRRAAA